MSPYHVRPIGVRDRRQTPPRTVLAGTITSVPPRQRQLMRPSRASLRLPSRRLEYAYYFFLVYSNLAPALGLSVSLLAGGMLLVLAALCIAEVRLSPRKVQAPVLSLLGCGLSFIAVQIAIHNESISNDVLRTIVTWILGLIIVQSLGLRQGFLHRSTVLLLVIGLIVVPYVTAHEGTVDVERARIELSVGGHLSHPNGLGEWFGFCAVYFAIFGLQTRHGAVRAVAWLVAVGSLYIVGLSVSRGALFATTIAIVYGFRRLLRHGFAPLLALTILVGISYESGIFDRAARYYSERGMEQSGRERLWPAAVERIFTAPLVGVGISDATMDIMPPKRSPPHNSFLYFALASGVIPLALWVAFWIQALRRSLAASETEEAAAFRIPFLLYTFTIVMLGDLGFTSPWALIALSAVACPRASYRAGGLLRLPGTGDGLTRPRAWPPARTRHWTPVN